jgi:nickel/cobalt transporter (NicO) family protein
MTPQSAAVTPARSAGRWGTTLLIAAGALLVVLICGAALNAGLGGSQAPPPKSPFGVGMREGGGGATGLVGWILATQSAFYRSLTAALKALKTDSGAVWALIGLSFAYGVFHAAGPGHGKAVISAYIVANESALKRGVGMAWAAALLQAVVAVALVTVLAGVLNLTAGAMTAVTNGVEIASFAAVACLGAVLLWRKADALAGLLTGNSARAAACAPDCGHAHLPGPQQAARLPWRDAAAAVVAAGLRPCSGAIIVLVFALSQGVFGVGIAATLAMALGVALTTGALAALAVFAKGAALRLAGGRGEAGLIGLRSLEVLAAAMVLALGLALVFGLWTAGSGG